MFRLENVIRKNGRCKVRIMPSELMGMADDDLLNLTAEPRHLEEGDLPGPPTLSESIHQLYLHSV